MNYKKLIALFFFLTGSILMLGTFGLAGLLGVIAIVLSLPYLVYKK